MSPAPAEVQGVGNDIKAEGVTELAYAVLPVSTVKELYALMKVADEMLSCINCSALIFVSRNDYVVPPANSEYILQKLPNVDKQLVWLENSYHVATLDNDKDYILQKSINFINFHTQWTGR
jgi:carboxylesterase